MIYRKGLELMKTIAIITARSGSKGLKDKNIKYLNGKPLLAYSIEAALESKVFDVVMVSTDSLEYKKIAIEYGAEVPFLRSEETSSDTASTRDCIIEVLNNYKKMGCEFDRFMILQPTSPLRTAKHIIEANELYTTKNAKSVISVCEMDHSPLWSNILKDDLCMDNFISCDNDKQRQALETFYRINGAIYLHDVKHYRQNEYYFDDSSFAYIMEKMSSIDIDDELDFLMAKCIMDMIKGKEIYNGF